MDGFDWEQDGRHYFLNLWQVKGIGAAAVGSLNELL
jgi:hypothetical protein